MQLVTSTAIITLALLIVGGTGQSTSDDFVPSVVRKPVRSLRSPHGLVLDQHQQHRKPERSSTVTESNTRNYHRSIEVTEGNTRNYQRSIEVSRPLTTGEQPVEAIELLYETFAFTYGKPPAGASYVPTTTVLDPNKWNKVVLKWSAVSQGIQYDRIAGVWLGGVEILRTSTAEPTFQGVIWEVEKDVTRYASLWKQPQEVVVLLNNVADSAYAGTYNVTLSVQFYLEGNGSAVKFQKTDTAASTLDGYSNRSADVIFPIHEASYSGQEWGYWFTINNKNDKFNTTLRIPPNTYKAVLEVCSSSHLDDEFWYASESKEGLFREVVVSIDDREAGAVYPFVVIYSGGFDPVFWTPVVAIGAFDLPTQDLDITPLLGNLLDGKNHTFALRVTNAKAYWLLQANLHIWVDPDRASTSGSLLEFSVPSSIVKVDSKSSNGTITTTASRNFSYVGYVASSFGNLTTSSTYILKFSNSQQEDGTEQHTETNGTIVLRTAAEEEVAFHQVVSSYPFHFHELEHRIVHAIETDTQSVQNNSSFFSSFSNNQSSSRENVRQTLSYHSSEGCYQRVVNVQDSIIKADNSTTQCS